MKFILTVLLFFLIPTVSAWDNTTYQFGLNYTDLTSTNLSIGNLTQIGASPFETQFGNMFWGLLFVMSFAMMWLRQEDVTLLSLVGILLSSAILSLFPADWKAIAMMVMVISLAGLMYSLIKGKS